LVLHLVPNRFYMSEAPLQGVLSSENDSTSQYRGEAQ
jgi:hypothetical protein